MRTAEAPGHPACAPRIPLKESRVPGTSPRGTVARNSPCKQGLFRAGQGSQKESSMKFGLNSLTRKTALCAAIGALSVGVAGNVAAAEKPIRIGVVTFLSGSAAGTFGIPARNGAELIADQINAGTTPAPYNTKGFGGTPIELKIIDEAGGSTKAVTEYRNLVGQQGVDMVVGYISSGDCLAVAPVAEELKKLTVLFDCGTPRIFEDNSYHYVFRTGAMGTMDNVSAALY